MPKEVYALVTFKNGNGQIRKCSLRHNLPFGKEEMRKWLMEEDESIKEVKFINEKELELYKLVIEGFQAKVKR